MCIASYTAVIFSRSLMHRTEVENMETVFGTETCSRKDPQKTAYQPNDVPYRAVWAGLWRSKDDRVALCANTRKGAPKNHDIK